MDVEDSDISSSESHDFSGEIVRTGHLRNARSHQIPEGSLDSQSKEAPRLRVNAAPRISATKSGARSVPHSKTFRSVAEAQRFLQSRENTAFKMLSCFRHTTVLICVSHVNCKARARICERNNKSFTLTTSGYHTRQLVPSSPDSSDVYENIQNRIRFRDIDADEDEDKMMTMVATSTKIVVGVKMLIIAAPVVTVM
jgi:hypothetical protein